MAGRLHRQKKGLLTKLKWKESMQDTETEKSDTEGKQTLCDHTGTESRKSKPICGGFWQGTWRVTKQASTAAKKDNMDPLLNGKQMEKAGDLHLGFKHKDQFPAMPGPIDQSWPKWLQDHSQKKLWKIFAVRVDSWGLEGVECHSYLQDEQEDLSDY